MPLTPFHMGAALAIKPVTQGRMSVISFGLTQVVIDIEPGIGMLRGADVLHGPSHTLIGAFLIAIFVAWWSLPLVTWIVNRWNKEVAHYGLYWLKESPVPTKFAVLSGALFGTLSHIFLDCLMHADIRPLSPFSDGNPLLGLVEHDHVYIGCAIAFFIGSIAWLVVKWTLHKQSSQGQR